MAKSKGPLTTRRTLLLSLAAIPLAIRVPLPRPRPVLKNAPIRVYLLRGLFVGGYIFSRGLDALAKKMESRVENLKASVHWNEEWLFLENDAEAAYKQNGARVVLIGHSAGADSALRIAASIAPAPVALVVTIDPTRIAPSISSNIEHFLNLYNSTTLLGGGSFRPRRFNGRFEQVDLSSQVFLHIGMDKSSVVQSMILDRVVSLASS
jgi:pimeloyl-ACP methyl ester carboxylesterase